MPQKMFLCDMDDTTFDYMGELTRGYEAVKSSGEPSLEFYGNKFPSHVKERIRLIRSQPGWWRNLPRIEHGLEILKMAIDLGYYTLMCTKGPGSCDNAWSEKKQCVEDNIGKVGLEVGLIETTDKMLISGDVMMDDYVDYMEPWIRKFKNRVGIMPDRKWNRGFYHPRVFRDYGTRESLDDARRLLIWAKTMDGPMPKFR